MRITPLSNAIRLGLGVIQEFTPCTISGECNRRSPWQRAIFFSATAPPPRHHIVLWYGNAHSWFINHSATISNAV
jgi:hypothetical protein